MKWMLALAVLGIVLLPELAAAQTVDYAKSEITFTGKQMGVPAHGRFRKFTAQIAFDPQKPDAAKAQVDVDLASIDTGMAETDTEVKNKSWFNVPAFPAAKFVSTGFKQLGADKFEAAGKLSIKGIAQDVRAPFTVKTVGATTTFEGSLVLLRLQFKVGEGVWGDTETVANEVQVRFRFVTTASR